MLKRIKTIKSNWLLQ